MELVILIGLQASGKSTFAESRYARSHVYISKDRMRNNARPARRQRQLIKEALASGKSVIIDNTNVTREDRAELISLGREHGVRIIGYYFESRVADCMARNASREGKGRLPAVALYATIKRLVLPTLAEGFDELHYVRLVENMGFSLSS